MIQIQKMAKTYENRSKVQCDLQKDSCVALAIKLCNKNIHGYIANNNYRDDDNIQQLIVFESNPSYCGILQQIICLWKIHKN